MVKDIKVTTVCGEHSLLSCNQLVLFRTTYYSK